jgi:hypothetical protein
MSASSTVYARSNTIQLLSNEPDSYIQPYHASPVTKNEQIHVKNVPLPVEQMVTESRPSQIETIDLGLISSKPEELPIEWIITDSRQPQTETMDLPSISSKSKQLPKVNNNSITSSNIVQTEFMNIMKNKVKTDNTSDTFENSVKKPRKTKVKHKKLSGIYVSIRTQPKKKQ